MADRIGLERVCALTTKQLWTANKNNLSFPQLRGDYQVKHIRGPRTEAWPQKYGPQRDGNVADDRLVGADDSSGLRFGNRPMDVQNDYGVALSAEVFGLLSWLQTTTEQLSRLGTHIQHPDSRERVNRTLALTVVKIAESDLEKRQLFRHQLLCEAKDYLALSNNTSHDNTKAEQWEKDSCDNEYETLHRAAGVKSDWNSFSNSSALWSAGRHHFVFNLVGLSSGVVTFTVGHLQSIEDLWKLARVQVQVLKIQLNSKLGSVETSQTSADDVIEKDIASSNHDLKTIKDFHDITAANSPERFLRFGMTHVIKDSSVAGSYDSGIDRCTTSSNYDTSSNARDDGYFARWGGSDDLWSNEGDAVSAEIDAALQGLSFKSKKLELPTGGQSADSLTEAGRDRGEHYEKDWEDIYDTVDRFSQNTLSLLSWLEELRDVQKRTGKASETFFYQSKEDRIEQIKGHAQRLYEAVKRDAALLTETLSTETPTIISVLDKIEYQSSGLGSLSPLPPPARTTTSRVTSAAPNSSGGTMAKKIARPLTSTPTVQSKRRAAALRDPLYNTRVLGVREQEWLISPRTSNLGRLGLRVRSSWYEFVDEYNAVLEWICSMERLADAEDAASVTRDELDLAYEDLLLELHANVIRRTLLRDKADDLLLSCPERRYDVRIRLTEIEMLWEQLEMRISMGRFSVSRYGRAASSFRPLQRALRASSPPSMSLVSPFIREEIFPPVQLEDHSLHQIRDQLTFGSSVGFTGMRRQQPVIKKALYDAQTVPRHEKEEKDLEEKSQYSSYDSPRWSMLVSPDLESATKSPVDDDKSADAISDAEREVPEVSSVDTITDKNVASTKSVDRDESDTSNCDPDETSSAVTDEDKRSITWDSDDSDVVPAAPSQVIGRLSLNPFLLSSRIVEFHVWLRSEEVKVQLVSSGKGLGWFEVQLHETLTNNQAQQLELSKREAHLERVLKSSEQIVSGQQPVVDEDAPDEEVDVGALAWSSLMLQQRFLILVLYCCDMECVIDRRLDAIDKECKTELIVAHPVEGLWSDRGEGAAVVPHGNEADYHILRSIM